MSTSILDKDLSEMSDADFDSLIESVDTNAISEQSVVKGTVLRIDSDRVLIDINYKAEGYVEIKFKNEDGEIVVNVGDVVEVYLERVNQELDTQKSQRVKPIKSRLGKLSLTSSIRMRPSQVSLHIVSKAG